MVNELTRAIARAIKSEFQEQNIFTEQLEQGLQEPCFFVLCLNQKEHKRLALRFLLEHTFVVQYFPQHGNEECWDVLSKLHRLLELIVLEDGSLVHGTNRKGEIKNGVLYFFVDYDFYMKKQKESTEYMEVLEVHEESREC